jgi:hypothetical protein
MRKKLLLGFFTIFVVFSSFISSPVHGRGTGIEILCCRPVCGGCGPRGDVMCDYKKYSECLNLKGWEVEDCVDCRARDRQPEQSD